MTKKIRSRVDFADSMANRSKNSGVCVGLATVGENAIWHEVWAEPCAPEHNLGWREPPGSN